MYNDLCKRENLSKCLIGRSQSRNKIFNGMIWNRAPKGNHVGQSNNVQIIYSDQINKPLVETIPHYAFDFGKIG